MSKNSVEVSTLAKLSACKELLNAKRLVSILAEEYGYTWKPVGGRENNAGTIEIGSDPGLALVERVTNAIDAVIERAAVENDGPRPNTPREAIELWFDVRDGDIRNLSQTERQELANSVVVSSYNGETKRRPSVQIRDIGIGISAAKFPDTILSLGESNKVGKAFLAGAYGQGGSTALAFSKNGTLIVSRDSRQVGSEDDHVATTFVRHNELDYRLNINGRYEYLVDRDGNVPAIPIDAMEPFEAGTLVLHFDMEIDQYGKQMTQLTNSFWWLFQNSLFRPMLPIWLEERRTRMMKKGKPLRRSIAGNFNRLNNQQGELVEHSDSLEVAMHHNGVETNFDVHFWVLRSTREKKNDETKSYVDPQEPIVFSQNGQAHGTERRPLISNRIHLPYLDKHLIILVELDRLHPKIKRALFSSTRDRMRKVAAYKELLEALCAAIAADDDLRDLNNQRKEELLSRYSEAERSKMRQRFAQMMKNLGPGVDAKAGGRGQDRQGRPPSVPSSRRKLEPLPTVEHPTFVRIVNSQSPIPVRVDRNAVIRIESDAPDGYLRDHVHARLLVTFEPDSLLKRSSSSDFKGGRARIMVEPLESAAAGSEGTITTFLVTPDGNTIQNSRKFSILPAVEAPEAGGEEESNVKVPEPIPIAKEAWGDLGWDDGHVAQVADSGTDVKIFVNMDNRNIVKLLKSGGYQPTGIKRMRANYLLYVAYYAWAQHAGEATSGDGVDEDYLLAELDRVSRTVVFSIAATGRLTDKN